MDEETRKIVAEFVAAHDAMHRVYGSTSVCYGGIGGAALTAHCLVNCQNPVHAKEQERYDNAYRAIRIMLERGTP